MNARKRRPARKKPQRWRAWSCAFAMGLVATPLPTLALAHSELQVRGAELLSVTGDPALVASSGTGSSSWASHSPRDLWGDVPDRESSSTLDHRVVRDASDTYRALHAGTPVGPPRPWESPRELPGTADEASPLPVVDIAVISDRPEVRQRLLATLGWTSVASHSSEVCPTPGSSADPSLAAEPSAERLMDGFRARGLKGVRTTGTRPMSVDSARVGSVAAAERGPSPASLVSAPGRATEPTSSRPAPKRPRVTPVNPRTQAGDTTPLETEKPGSEELLRPRTVQADFRLEPVPASSHRPTADVKPSGWQTADVVPERLTQITAEVLLAEDSEMEASDALVDQRVDELEGGSEDASIVLQLPLEMIDRADEIEVEVQVSELAPDQRPVARLELSPARSEQTRSVSEAAREMPSEPMAPKVSEARPRSRTAVMSGVSDEEPAIGTSQLALTPPVASPKSREPVRSGVSDERPDDESRTASRQSPWHGVTDEEEPVRAGVTDTRSLARAGVSDDEEETLGVWAGVSDEEPVALGSVSDEEPVAHGSVSDEEGPQFAGASDEEFPARERVSDEDSLAHGSVSDDNEPTLAGVSDLGGESDGDADQPEGSLEPMPSAQLLVMPAMELTHPRALAHPPAPAQPHTLAQPHTPTVPRKADTSQDLTREAVPPRAREDQADAPLRLDLAAPRSITKSRVANVTRASVSSGDFDAGTSRAIASGDQLAAHGRMKLEPRQNKLIRTKEEIVRAEVVDRAVCEVVQLNSDEISIIGKRAGQTHVQVWVRGKTGEVLTNYHVTVGSIGQSATRQADSHEQLVTRLAQQYPHADLELLVSEDKVIVEGRVRSNQEAVDILSKVRRVWLVPVEDRIEVRR